MFSTVNKSLILLIFMIAIINFSFAQRKEANGKNIIKVDLSGVALRNYKVGAERFLFKPISLGVWYSTVPLGQSPSIYTTKYALNFNDNLSKFFEGIELEYHALMAEARIYFGRGTAKGFYIGPFYQTSKHRFEDFQFEYQSDTGNSEQLERTSGSIYTDSYGLLIGAQFNIGRHLVIDCYIGPNYSSASGNFLGLTQNLSISEEASLAINLESIFAAEPDLLDGVGRIVTSSTGAHVEIYPDWIDFRVGMSVGFRF